MPGLLYDIKYTPMIYSTEVAAGTSAIASTQVLDMAGWDGVLFIDIPQSVTAAGVRYILAQTGASSTYGALADDTNLCGTTSAATTTGMSNGPASLLDIYKPLARFVSVKQVRATQNSAGGTIAIQYKNRVGPVAAGTTLMEIERLQVAGVAT